jgi:hypothetical protein
MLHQIRPKKQRSEPSGVISEQVAATASSCTHYAMCKIDYLGTGLCRPGVLFKYVAYWPQGRMEILGALHKGLIPVTDRLVHIANTCTPCGKCDKQCNYYTDLRIGQVMKALKDYVDAHLADGKPVVVPPLDPVLQQLQAIVGEEWATNDPCILISYSRDSGLIPRRIPKYVVMVENRAEVAAVIRLANSLELSLTFRSSGANAQGMALGDDIIVDFHRMKRIEIDPDNWSATIEPGVTAFEVQQAASEHHMRACVAEPAAGLCSNVLFSRVNTLFNHAYGMGGDLVIDAEFVDLEGRPFRLVGAEDRNLYAFRRHGPEALYFLGFQPRRACTEMTIKLFPVSSGEECLFVPYADLASALAFARELGRRRIGIGVGVVSTEYIGFLLTLGEKAGHELEAALRSKLHIEYVVVVIGDRHTRAAVEELTDTYADAAMVDVLMRGGSRLNDNAGFDLLASIPTNKKPYEVVMRPDMLPLLEMALEPQEADLYRYADRDLQRFYADLFSRSHMRDFVWLNTFRVNSARIGRSSKYYPVILWIALKNISEIAALCADFDRIGQNHGVRCGFGYSNTIDFGKWALIEYDFYHDTDEEMERVKEAYAEA